MTDDPVPSPRAEGPGLSQLARAESLVALLCQDPDGSADAVSLAAEDFFQQSLPDARMALLIACCRLARTVHDAVDAASPGALAPPTAPPWQDGGEPHEAQISSGIADAMTMISRPADLGSDRKWRGYGADQCPLERYSAAVGTAAGYAALVVRAVADDTATPPADVLAAVADAIRTA